MLPRLTYYADPERMRAAQYGEDVKLEEPSGDKPANVVSSLLPNGLHAPVLDLDFPAMLVPSSTPGHSHLYLDVQLPWDHYLSMLLMLQTDGILQRGFVEHASTRGKSVVRMPWFTKEPAALSVNARADGEPF